MLPLFLLYVMASSLILDARITRPPQPYSSTGQSTQFDDTPSSRRDFVERGLSFVGCSSALMYGNPVLAVAGDDPFAQLDSFASSLTTTGQQSSPNTSCDKKEEVSSTMPPKSSTSALDAALDESRKRKVVDPRTHG